VTPSESYPATPVGWFVRLARERPRDYRLSDRRLGSDRPWPDGFDPRTNPVFACNAIDIQAPVSAVFRILMAATEWPSFYPNAAEVSIEGGRETLLRAGTRFVWRTFGVRQRSEVTLFETDRALGWRAESPGTHAYHRWFVAAGGGLTHVLTEECQFGFVASVDRYWMNRSLNASHQLWLEGLRQRIQDEPPAAAVGV
jgi:hypothetical protein